MPKYNGRTPPTKEKWLRNKISKVSNQPCSVNACPESAYYEASMLCHNCYIADRMWGRKTPTQRAKRRQALAKFAERMTLLEGTR